MNPHDPFSSHRATAQAHHDHAVRQAAESRRRFQESSLGHARSHAPAPGGVVGAVGRLIGTVFSLAVLAFLVAVVLLIVRPTDPAWLGEVVSRLEELVGSL